MKIIFKLLPVIFTLLVVSLQAQRLSYNDRIEVIMEDETNVILYKDMDSNNYYYLPPSSSIRLAQRNNEEPEFLFAKYTTNETQAAGGVQGAIIHFLVQWGLTADQLTDLNKKVQQKTGGTVKGPVRLKARKEKSFDIISATVNAAGFASTVITSGQAPPTPDNKASVAAKLDKYGAQLLASTFEKKRSIADVDVVMNYDYITYVKAVDATITCDWARFRRESESIAKDYLRTELDNDGAYQQALAEYKKNAQQAANSNLGCAASASFANMVAARMAADKVNGKESDVWLKLKNDQNTQGDLLRAGAAADQLIGNTTTSGSGTALEYYVGEGVMRSMMNYMYESKVINMDYKEAGGVDEEKLKPIRQAFLDYFLSSFGDQEFPIPEEGGELGEIDEGSEDRVPKEAEGVYAFRSCSQFESIEQKTSTVNLNFELPVYQNHQMLENLSRVYKNVQGNPNCVYSVILDDPFYAHREINFIVDLDALDIFEQEINYVTVNVKKRRSSGNDFTDAITIDASYLNNKGALASTTYARGEDRNSDVYQYQTQWSLRGGKVYPDNPRWERGDWEGVTLGAPLTPQTIEFEADLGDLKEKGITRATLQVRYEKFGEEIETNIPLTVSKGEPLVEHMIFMDKDNPNYAYRLVLTHKEKGKLADPEWHAKFNDGYVYATIPELQGEKLKRWLSAAKELIVSNKDTTITNPAEKLLDRVLRAAEALFGNN